MITIIATSTKYIRPNTFVKADVVKIKQNVNHIILANSGMLAISLLMHWAKYRGYTIYSEETTYPETRCLIWHRNLLNLRGESPKIPGKAAIFVDSPNVFGYSYDIRSLAKKVHEAGGILIVDCSYCSSLLDTSLNDGADFVVESLSKYALASEYTLLGAVYNNNLDEEGWKEFEFCASSIGININNDQVSFLRERLKRLPSRMETIISNAREVANILESEWEVPASSSDRSGVIVLPYDLIEVFSQSKLFIPFATYGGDKSAYTICQHNFRLEDLPYLGYLRLSIGIENVEEIKEELGRLRKLYIGTKGYGAELNRFIQSKT